MLVTGATGSVGSELVKMLAAKGVAFRALVRSDKNTEQLAVLPGAEIVVGDLGDTASITQALRGIDRAFLLTNSSEEAESLQSGFVDAAQHAGVRHIVKLSQLHADIHSPVRFLRYHAVVEQKIIASGMAYTFLRPNLYMQGLLGFREPIMHQGKFFASAGDAKVSLVDTRDIARVAAEALTNQSHEHKIYNITGPEALSHAEIAACFTEVLGREIRFINVSPEEMRYALTGVGFPAWQTDGLIEDYAHYARGEASEVSPSVKEVTGEQPRDFRRFVSEFAGIFS